MSFSPPRPLTAVDGYETRMDKAEADSIRRQIPSWAVSFGAHALVLLSCLFIVRPSGFHENGIFTDAFDDSAVTDPFNVDATATDVVAASGEVGSMTIGNGSGAQNPDNADQQVATVSASQAQLQSVVERVITPRTVGTSTEMPTGDKTDLSAGFNSEGASEVSGSVEGSLDRLTHELTATLKDDKTLAIWVFDASLSLRDRRNAIADRFENVYKQLGQLKVGQDKALKTAAVSFGEKVEILTPEPVDDVREVAEKVRKMKDDTSGKEMTLTAIMTAANKFLSYRLKMKRNVMIIVVTDERGDDFQNIESELVKLRKWGMKIYCVGNAAVFGREKGYVTFKDSDETVYNNVPVDLGPESAYPERLELPFFGVQVQDLNHISSSFGPYGLTRLCTETGGLYLITDDSKVKFDPLVMKSYRPDYRPLRTMETEVMKNKAKQALINVCKNTSMKDAPVPTLIFRADNDNALRQEITAAQPLAARYDAPLQEMQQMLEVGEKDRDKLDTPRWRASYDLAMGRVLAMRVRYFGFNKMAAEMKLNPKTFKTAGNNQWRLVESSEITTGPEVKKLEKRAREYLTRVVDEHPGTPWALLAEKELSKQMGWQWEEGKADYVAMDRNAAEQRRIQLAREEEIKKDPKKAPPKAKAPPTL